MRAFLTMGLMLLASPALAADIFEAARRGDTAAVAAYMAAGGALDVRNERGFTPFILASYHDRQEVAAQLLAAGADPCATDAQGSNAFMGVAFRGHDAMAGWLLQHTACDVNHRNHAGQTALMMAALFGREPMLRLLLDEGADPAMMDARGNTAASLAEGQGLTHLSHLLQYLRPRPAGGAD